MLTIEGRRHHRTSAGEEGRCDFTECAGIVSGQLVLIRYNEG